jgi:hypothetical protein
MDMDNGYLIVCLGIGIALGIPAIIYLSLRRGNEANAINLMRNAVGRARFPWEDEDKALAELARRVSNLQESEQAHSDTRAGDDIPQEGDVQSRE